LFVLITTVVIILYGVAIKPPLVSAEADENFSQLGKTNRRINAYEPPIGIPPPPFGIDETHMMYLGLMFDYDGDGTPEAPYKDAGNGPYTHYVDSTHPNCSNAYEFGTADDPLCDLYKGDSTITLPPGSVVEIHGGPYSYQNWKRIISQGTTSNPVFVRAVDPQIKVRIQGDNDDHDLRLEGSFFILENLEFYRGAFIRIWDGSDHISVRNVEIHNPIGEFVGWGTALSGGEDTHDIVLYQNHIHHNVRGNDLDLHGTGTGPGSERIWILENHIHHNSGDAFQACHYCLPAPRFVYVGGNEMHHDRENGVDIKTIHDVVVSENVIYGYEPSSTSSGDAVVIGSNGLDPGAGYGPDNAWFLFNDIRDSHRGIRVEGVYNGWILGNTIHNVGSQAVALDIKEPSENVSIIGNTISSAEGGVHHSWRCGVANVIIENNIFDNLTVHHIALDPCVANVSSLENNLFWNNGADVAVEWGNAPFMGLDAGALNATVNGVGNIIGDPLFVSVGSFDLQAGSAAVDAGKESDAYQAFYNSYGMDIRKDFAGASRPQGAGWDVGAYEFTPALILNGIPGDQTIRLQWAVNTTLPVTATWRIAYIGPQGDLPSPITSISNTVRAYNLTGMTNYVAYTVTLNAMLESASILTDTVTVMPADRFVLLPVLIKENP
jgi:hypothetical protein